MIDIHSATAEIRRGKRRKKIEEETTGQKYNVSATHGGHNKQVVKVI